MPPWEFWVWALALLACLVGFAVLLLALLHVRYRAEWHAEWTGDLSLPRGGRVRIEFGFPGFMRAWEPTSSPPPGGGANTTADVPSDRRASGDGRLPAHAHHAPAAPPSARNRVAPEETPVARHPTPDDQVTVREDTSDEQGKSREAPPDPQRLRKAFFRLATDGPAWAHLIRYGFRVLRLVHSLLRPRVRLATGHPDPALLGRLAGHWHAVSPLLPLGDTTMNFRFQDRRPSLRLNVEGGFSALSLLFFGIALVGVFPFFGIGRRAWRGWRQQGLTGWRAWAYRRIQSM